MVKVIQYLVLKYAPLFKYQGFRAQGIVEEKDTNNCNKKLNKYTCFFDLNNLLHLIVMVLHIKPMQSKPCSKC